MTHSEAVATNSLLTPTDCPGELARSASIPDRHFADGEIRERTVDVYHCTVCGFHVSMADHVALNSYHVPSPQALVASLATHVDARQKAQGRD